MITIYRKNDTIANGNEREIEIRGKSTDEKPKIVDKKDVANGTVFIEIDTGKMYLYDSDSEQWKEV